LMVSSSVQSSLVGMLVRVSLKSPRDAAAAAQRGRGGLDPEQSERKGQMQMNSQA
jgi:hypothetical protein